MDHDDLVKEAEELAKGMKQGEKIDCAFVYSYVANHELRFLGDQVARNKWLIIGVGVPILLTLVATLFNQILG